MGIIWERQLERFKREAKVFPCRVNRASSIGGECERELVYARTRWADQKLPAPEKIALFREGNHHEPIVFADLVALGFEVREQQRPFEITEKGEVLISGRIDARVEDTRGELKGLLPLELKTADPNVFRMIRSWEDIVKSDKPWMKKYPAQFHSYLYAHDEEHGIYVVKNKSTGELRDFIVTIDLDYVQTLLDKARRINDHVAKKTIPDPTPGTCCQICDFKHLCLPDQENAGITMIDSPELPKLLARREAVKGAAKEYDQVDGTVKGLLKEGKIGAGEYSVEDFLIVAKETKRGITYSIERLDMGTIGERDNDDD